jgi:PAS domain S-box-containing protein
MTSHLEDNRCNPSQESSIPGSTREPGSDADQPRRVECELRTRSLQQEALVSLGQQALSSADLGLLLDEAVNSAKRLAEEKAVMAEIGRIISSTLDIEDVYERFSEEVRKIISFDRITITRIVRERTCSRILYTSGTSIPEREPHGEYPLAGTISEQVMASKKGEVFAPLSEEQLVASFPGIMPMWRAGYRSFMLAPLISRDEVIGALVLSCHAPGNYTAADLTLAENVASQISGAIANAQLFSEHRQMAAALREREASLQSIFRAAPVGIGVVSNRVLLQVNERICQMVGRPREELIGRSSRIFYTTDDDFKQVGREKYEQIRKNGTGTVETRWQHKSGDVIDVLLNSTPLNPNDWASGVTFTALDITESKRSEQARKDLEDKLRQAQKMEAIGTLAGGIAHDFNNILAAIIGFAELAKIEASGNIDLDVSINEVLNASFRARDLVRQILTFSRQTETESGPIQIHLIIKEALKLLRASLPSTIQLRPNISSHGTIMGDPTQIHQVVMNLCTNAYHAMREIGGLLEVSVSETCIGPSAEADLKLLRPGPHLKLSVRDTGHGIDPAIIHRIFDPYFTTKEKGKGTGLGLAVVHGVVKCHQGAIQVESELGKGTRFDIYFPMMEGSGAAAATAGGEVTVSGRERILFVDDEPAIEELGKRLIGSLGYEVSTCGNAADALEKFRTSTQDFDLVITDMTMPRMTGNRLATELMRIRPSIPVIVCTGFSEQINKEKAQAQGIKAFIMKPFLKCEIAAVIRDVLDRRPA